MRTRGVNPVIAGVLAVVAIVAASVWRTWDTGVNGDIMYVLGGLRAARDGGVPFDEIFVARPFAYKCWIAALDAVRAVFVGEPSSLAAMRVVRLAAYVVVLAVCAVLHRGLRRHVGQLPAVGAATAAAVGLLLSPRFNFLEPDWTAALAAVLAGGLLLCFADERVACLLGGIALWLTVTMKLSTAVFAGVTVILVFQIARRRAVGGALVGAVVSVGWYVLSRLLQPLEWRWFADQAALVHDSPIHHAPRAADFSDLIQAVLNAALMSPIVVGGVAAAALFVVRPTERRQRRVRLLVALLCVGLAVASGFAQGEWFLYHFSDLAILAAVVWGFALGVADRFERTALLAAPLVSGLVAAALIPSFQGHDRPRYWTLIVVTVLAAAVPAIMFWRRRPTGPSMSGRSAATLAALAAGVAFVAGMTTARPDVPLTIVGYDGRRSSNPTPESVAANLEEQQRAGERIGARTPVLYLAYGATVYAFPNPTPCPYPSPQWVQRTAVSAQVHTYWSFRDNMACLTDTRARYMVRSTSWFDLAKMPPQIRALVAEQFDCSRQLRPAPAGLQICPRRH